MNQLPNDASVGEQGARVIGPRGHGDRANSGAELNVPHRGDGEASTATDASDGVDAELAVRVPPEANHAARVEEGTGVRLTRRHARDGPRRRVEHDGTDARHFSYGEIRRERREKERERGKERGKMER